MAKITKSWSGTLSRLTNSGENRSQMLRSMVEELKNQTDTETDYFIASFGARADHKSYEVFADAVRDLH
jgi:hypothetical protein